MTLYGCGCVGGCVRARYTVCMYVPKMVCVALYGLCVGVYVDVLVCMCMHYVTLCAYMCPRWCV